MAIVQGRAGARGRNGCRARLLNLVDLEFWVSDVVMCPREHIYIIYRGGLQLSCLYLANFFREFIDVFAFVNALGMNWHLGSFWGRTVNE